MFDLVSKQWARAARSSVNLVCRTYAVRRHYQKLAWIVAHEGLGGGIDRLRGKLAHAIQPPMAPRMVRDSDILAADIERPPQHCFAVPGRAEPITLNWIMAAPNAGSGGHTTIFRIVRFLEANGYRNRVYFYDARLTTLESYVAILREYYGFYGPVDRYNGTMADAHGVVSTSWPTAYASLAAASAGKRFYFVQDFEPDFYAVSADRILAENTYHMGFHAITAGRWLAEKLSTEYGMRADHFEFGCDTNSYFNLDMPRNGIAFYARPSTPRRGYELGMLALQLFAARRPDIEIHLYGEPIDALPFEGVSHGLATPQQLNILYNQCFAGLSLSLTNVSLVPLEMLAAGCIPVLNDARHNRLVIDDPSVRYAPATPQALARALEDIVSRADFDTHSRTAAARQRGLRWDGAGEAVDRAIRKALTLNLEAAL